MEQDLLLGLELLLGRLGEQAGGDGLRESGESEKPPHVRVLRNSELKRS